jgi:hypothetical protein
MIMGAKPHKCTKPSNSAKRDLRFRQLLDRAMEGDETAVSDLWKEFDFNFLKKGGLYE